MAIKKSILAKLMSLNNEKADEELAKFANGLLADIQSATDNDLIFDDLDTLQQFIYKVPKTAIQIIERVIASPHSAIVKKTDFGDIEGKSHADLLKKCTELLGQLRYISTDEILPVLAKLAQNSNETVKTKALEVLKNLSRYDFTLLTKTNLGYAPQRKVLDFMSAWAAEEKKQNFNFIEAAAERLLSSSVEGTTTATEPAEALTFHFAAVKPSDFLKQIRKDTIDLVYDLYQISSNSEQKLKLVRVLEEAVRTPLHVQYGDDIASMITDSGKYLIEVYKKMLFDDSGKFVGSLAVAQEIERRLYYISKNELLNSSEAEGLLKAILADRLYSLNRLLTGDEIIFREENGWDTAEQKRTDDISVQVASVNEANLNDWIRDLNAIASEKGPTNEWHFTPFRQLFIKKLAMAKPALSERILDNAFSHGRPLINFVENFLTGFRLGSRFDLWEKFVQKFVEEKKPESGAIIPYSLIPDRGDSAIGMHDSDWELMDRLIEQKAEFAFLTGQTKNEFGIHSSIITCLIENYRFNPKKAEKLIVKEIVKNPQYCSVYMQALSFPIMKKFIDFTQWGAESVEAIKNFMIRSSSLDWHSQDLLLAIGMVNPQHILDVFMGRMDLDEKRKSKRKAFDISDRYEAIPFNMNHSLSKFVLDNAYIQKHLLDWSDKITPEWSSYNWNIGHFLERIGVNIRGIIDPLIKKGDTENLLKAIFLIMPYDSNLDLDLCMEIIGKTDDEKIIGQLRSQLFSTGVVSGEYGIAHAHEQRARELERFLDNTNPRVKSFVEKASTDLNLGAASAKQSADEEKQLRKIQFEE